MEGSSKRYLHGTIEATILHASPPNPSHCLNCFGVVGGAKPAFVRIKIGKTKAAETSHEDSRVWNQKFSILCCHPLDTVVTVSLKTVFSTLGKVRIPAISLLNEGGEVSGDQYRLTSNGKPISLVFTLRFVKAESEPGWGRGIPREGFRGIVGGATFPQRSNCGVVLYQDTHHGSHFCPPVGHGVFKPRKLWEDVYKAIDGAKYVVYIAGWSFNPNIVLVRDPETDIPEAVGVELGELLKRKAEQGVAVRLMIWDDQTSLHLIKNEGVMHTHDERAFDYFKHTKVICRPCPRLHHSFPTLFTHHQKTLIVDASITEPFDLLKARDDDDDANRKIVSFIGGVDLFDGRYDTEEHSIFRTLNSSHAHDFYQTNFAGAEIKKGGPREAWHDAHALVMGDAARDVLANFEQRWGAARNDPSLLVSLPLTKFFNSKQQHGEDWNVQVLRSVDRASVSSLPCATERSIHDAYVTAIRRAEKFIYIENQYFIGGCQLWDEDKDSGCTNLIPIEIALKVASKIRAGERFTVYILMPMWSEGVPESEPVQEILNWTRLTMAAMYRLIGEAIQESSGSKKAHPTDYLNFFCLANREERHHGEYVPPDSPPRMTDYWKAQQNRRFMIYVHSKIMIVDDEYILVGSANVNQRSMDGDRDTEIAVGCYQPDHLGQRGSRRGDIHKYRLSLWYEHTGRTDKAFLEPQSVKCVSLLREIGSEMWDAYSREDVVVDMGGAHLVSYPVMVSEDGAVDDLIGTGGVFPDTAASIKGARSKLLPSAFTT